MKKIILIFLFAIYSAFSFSQDTSAVIIQDQAIKYTNFQLFSDSVRFSGIGGSGSVLRITEDGWVYIDVGTQDTLIDTSKVVNLNKYLNLKQDLISVDSNFTFTGDTIFLNDTIWTEVGRFSDEVRIKNNAPRLLIIDANSSANNKNIQLALTDGELVFQYLNDNEITGGGDYMTLERVGRNMTSLSIFDNAVARIKLNNSGTGVFEDTVRTGQLKASGLLYPLSDGANKQVIKTDGSGNLTFSGVGALLTAGTGITISNDTISSTATGSDGDWTINGNYVYNLSDSIGIGVSDPSVALEINGRAKITNIQTGLTVTNTGASTALNLISNVAGSALTINSGVIDSLSNDATLSGNDANDIVSESAVKGYVDNRILNDTRVSWAADVDTSARVDGFVLKWNNGTKTHYYDTAGAGGGGGTYFAGAGLQLAANVFSIANDGVETSMIQNDAVTYSKIQNVGGNSILARTASGSGSLSEVSLASSRLLGRGSTGNVAAISLNGLNMSGNVLTNPYTGTVTNIASGNGMSFSSITTTGTVTLGTPTAVTSVSTNSVGTNTHTHAFTPAGSDGQIQFNSSNVLSADADLYWNNSSKRLGIGTTSPSAKLDVTGNIVGDTISINNLYRLPLADGTSGQIISTNGSGVLSFGDLTVNNSNWSGTDLSVTNGGTGASTLTGVVIGNGTSAMTAVSGTANQVLRRNATNTGYEFYTPSAGTGTVTSVAAGNGMSFTTITGSGSVTMGTPTTLTGTTTNSVGVGTHAHALDFTTFQSNTRTFYLDTARVPDGFLSDDKVAITNQEKVIAFTLSTNADSVRLDAGYYTVHGMVDIQITNDDTTAGISGHFQNYQLNAFVTEATQALGRGLSGRTTVLETAEANVTPPSIRDADENPLDGTVRLHLVTTPVKFYLDGTQFVALTIKAAYPSPVDFVAHKKATMIINRVVDFDEREEQLPDITEE